MGVSSLTWTDFGGWMAATHHQLMDWELEIICMLDTLYVNVIRSKTYTSIFAEEQEQDRG